ncbi:serine hydrolase FSH [Xylariaceae sp. FL0255]|nr:serine hydrolase FSH [Xylariaceae sp. FL0255]
MLQSQRTRKVLCLHGIGTNGDIMEAQTGSLRYQLANIDPNTLFSFDFVNGSHPWPAHPEVAAVYGGDQHLSYYDGSSASALQALDDLAAHVIDNGPYDSVMGFSMGGSLAATLLLSPQDPATDRPDWAAARAMIHSAIFMSSAQPWETIEMSKGRMVKVRTQEVGTEGRWKPIEIPTFHLWSPRDLDIEPCESQDLMHMCKEDQRADFQHDAGHAIPTDVSGTETIAIEIQHMFARL